MTGDHDDIVRRVIYTRFKNLPEWHDDLYQEGRLALLTFRGWDSDCAGVNAFRWVTRCCWRFLFRAWGYYEEGGEQKRPIFSDSLETDETIECRGYNITLSSELLRPLTYKERDLIINYYMDDATSEECALLVEYSEKSVREMASYIKKKLLIYEKTGKYTAGKKRVLDTKTGIYYKSIQAAAKIFGMPHTTLRNYLKGRRPNPTTLVLA